MSEYLRLFYYFFIYLLKFELFFVLPTDRIMRQGDKFEEFLIRATRYNSVLSNNSRRLLLVKELPNVFLDDKEGFHSVLE